MKTIKVILVLAAFVFCGKVFSQDMAPPPPIQSEFLESVLGTWVSEPFEMMGQEMIIESAHEMVLNGQFMKIEVTAKSNGAISYKGTGYYSVDSDNTLTGWFFDIYGKTGMLNYTGTVSGKTAVMNGTTSFNTEKREISVEGDKMYHKVTIGMIAPLESEMKDIVLNITYNKKN